MYNGAKLPPVSVSFSSCPTYTVTFAIYYKESKWHINETEPISDEQFLQTFANVESGNTLTDKDESITMINDESRREHVKYPHTGPSIVYLRNNVFHGSICLEQVNDLFPNFFVICDGGPDYHPKSYKNEMLYTKLWKEAGLDQLVVTCNAAGWSVMNPIEHLWSPLSSSLTSVTLNYSFREDGVPPCNDTSITKEEQTKQNKDILDEGEYHAFYRA